MGKLGRRALVLLVAALSMLVIASCGGDDDDSGGSSGAGGTKGGTLNIDYTSYPDFLDPGLSYTVDGWEALHLAYTVFRQHIRHVRVMPEWAMASARA